MPRNKTEAQAAYERRIEEFRKLMRPTPVRLHHEPRWLTSLVRKRLKACGRSCRAGWSIWNMVTAAGIDTDWLDHWGSTDGGKAFVSEPYLNPSMVFNASVFAEWCGLYLRISAVSEWNPPSTIRLEFRQVVQVS